MNIRRLLPTLVPLAVVFLGATGSVSPLPAQRPLVTAAELSQLLPYLNVEGRPIANAEELALKLAPFRTDLATLSRDGRYLAYTVTEGPYTRVDIVSIDNPNESHAVHLGDMATAEVVALEWTSPRRLVLATEDWFIGAIDLGAETIRSVLTPASFRVRLTPEAAIVGGQMGMAPSEEMNQPPRFLNVNPDGSDSVIVAGVAGLSLHTSYLVTARLDMATGQWRRIDDLRINSTALVPTIDLQGRIRLAYRRSLPPFSWSARIMSADGEPGGWRRLDRVLPASLAETFERHPSELWQGAHIPLGFGVDPNVLYLAAFDTEGRARVSALDLTADEQRNLPETESPIALAREVSYLEPRALGRKERILRQDNASVFYTDFESYPPAPPMVFERATGALVGLRTSGYAEPVSWLDPQIGAIHQEVTRQFPDRRVVFFDWDDARNRMLFRVESRSDPGRYFVYDRTETSFTEYLRRAPLLQKSVLHASRAASFARPDGTAVTGTLTLATNPVINPPPLVCIFADGPWQPVVGGYSSAAQMLAEYGCNVLQLDYRGTLGVPGMFSEQARSRPDLAAAEDLGLVLDRLMETQPYDRRRVALVGVGYGGWLALRASQVLPERIRCVVTLNGHLDLKRLLSPPPVRELPDGRSRNLEAAEAALAAFAPPSVEVSTFSEIGTTGPGASGWEVMSPQYGGPSPEISGRLRIAPRRGLPQTMLQRIEDDPISPRAFFAKWYFEPALAAADELSALAHLDDVRAPIFIGQETFNPFQPTADANRLRRALRRRGLEFGHWELPTHDWSRPIDQRPEVWLQVARFFNEQLYTFGVEIGETVETGTDEP